MFTIDCCISFRYCGGNDTILGTFGYHQLLSPSLKQVPSSTMFSQVILIATFAVCIHGFPTGAPPSSCNSKFPIHGRDPQTSTFPYDIVTEKNQINSGESIKVTIKGKNELKFRGFLLTARSGDIRVGTFSALDNRSHTIDCGSGDQGNAITHSDGNDKTRVEVSWTAPKSFKGEIVFYVTLIEDIEKYWSGQKSTPIIVL